MANDLVPKPLGLPPGFQSAADNPRFGSTVHPSYLVREMDIFPLTEPDINELAATTTRAQVSSALAAFAWSSALACGLTLATLEQNAVLAGQLKLATILSISGGILASFWAYRETDSKSDVLDRVRQRCRRAAFLSAETDPELAAAPPTNE